ncbi:MAG: hypothetical protein AAFX59_17250, partial [Pseudomonadota bacterium]
MIVTVFGLFIACRISWGDEGEAKVSRFFFKSDKYVGEFFGVIEVKEETADLGFTLIAPAYAAGDEEA